MHQVTVTDQTTVATPERAEFDFDRKRGEVFYVEVAAIVDGEASIDDSREFGPYLLWDAINFAQHAADQADPMTTAARLDKAHADIMYPGNDWTGLLDGLKN